MVKCFARKKQEKAIGEMGATFAHKGEKTDSNDNFGALFGYV